MKKGLCSVALTAALLAFPAASQAHTYDRDDSDHPMRIVAYILHPIGVGIEYAILRPIHCLVSMNAKTNLIFGHDSHGKYCCSQTSSVITKATPVDATKGPKTVADAAKPANNANTTDTRAEITPLGPADELLVIYFDYDRSELRPDQVDRLDKNLQYLKSHPDLKVSIEGHCDERGTTEYNLALGERRAKSVMSYYLKNGIAADRLSALSKGEEEPVDPGHDEAAWAKNRRAEFDKVK